MTTSGRIKLIASAGSFKSLQAAIMIRAVSVNFGGNQLNRFTREYINIMIEVLS